MNGMLEPFVHASLRIYGGLEEKSSFFPLPGSPVFFPFRIAPQSEHSSLLKKNTAPHTSTHFSPFDGAFAQRARPARAIGGSSAFKHSTQQTTAHSVLKKIRIIKNLIIVLSHPACSSPCARSSFAIKSPAQISDVALCCVRRFLAITGPNNKGMGWVHLYTWRWCMCVYVPWSKHAKKERRLRRADPCVRT